MKKKIILNGNVAFVLYNFRYGLMKELEKKGYEIICMASEDSYVQKIEENGWKFLSCSVDRKGKNIINDIILLVQYFKILRKEKPNYLLNFTIKPNIYGTIIGRLLNIPTINNITGLGEVFETGKSCSKLINFLYKFSFRFPKKVFFQNNEDLNIFLKNNLIKKEITALIPGSGVPIDRFFPMTKLRKDNKIIFLFLGRISEKKGVRIINEISKKIKEEFSFVEFQLLGKIYEEEEGHISLKELKEWEKESYISYLGTSNDVRKQIREADFIIYPSYYREGVPRALIEAAAMGKIILTTDNVGCRDIVKDGYNGYLAKPNDVQSMLDIVKKAINLKESNKKELEKNSRKKAIEEFDEKIVIKKYLLYLKE